MRDDQHRTAGRYRHRFGESARRRRLAIRLRLAEDEQVSIMTLNDQRLFVETLGQAPFAPQVTALCALFLGGGGCIVFGLRSSFVGVVNIKRRHHSSGESGNVDRRLHVDTHEMRAKALCEIHCDLQSRQELGARITMNEYCLVGHVHPLIDLKVETTAAGGSRDAAGYSVAGIIPPMRDPWR